MQSQQQCNRHFKTRTSTTARLQQTFCHYRETQQSFFEVELHCIFGKLFTFFFFLLLSIQC